MPDLNEVPTPGLVERLREVRRIRTSALNLSEPGPQSSAFLSTLDNEESTILKELLRRERARWA